MVVDLTTAICSLDKASPCPVARIFGFR
jgi:hypothetical protein